MLSIAVDMDGSLGSFYKFKDIVIDGTVQWGGGVQFSGAVNYGCPESAADHQARV